MKKIIAAVAVLVPALVQSKPFGAMSAEEIKAADDSNWGDRISISGPAGDELAKIDDNLRTLLAKVKEDSAAALAALAEDHDFYEQYALKLAPGDRKAVESLFKECSQFLEQVDTLLVKESEKLLAAAKDTSTEVGMLRANTGFSPHKAFLAAGPTQFNGCPVYVRRVRVMLEDCKKRYMRHLDAMRRRYHDAPDRHIPKGWQ